jgi:arginyl-tRNA synthetase
VSLQEHLSQIVGTAFAEVGLPAELGAVVTSQRPELAQFQCNGAMAAAQQADRAPREIATEIASRLADSGEIGGVEVAGPGFININVTDEVLASWATETAAHDHLGFESTTEPMTVVVDYAGPNVAKAMHVGHLRATIIGDSLARLFAFAGNKVIRDPHFGDWGFQMGLLIAAIEEEQPGLPYFDTSADSYPGESPVDLADLQRIYPEAAERARNDDGFTDRAREATVRLQQGYAGYRALWRHMKSVSEESQREDFAALGVTFDLWYGESDVHDRLEPLVANLQESGVAEESEGALIVRVDQEDDSRDLPPLLLASSVGGFLYSTTDLATVEMRLVDLRADLCLYVVDRRQSDHFVQVFRVAQKAGIVPNHVGLEHIGFGTMNGPDGKPFKTREGGVVRLGDVIEMIQSKARERLDEAHLAEEYPDEERTRIAKQVGVAALKFGDLSKDRLSDYVFDLDRFSSFEGKTGPYLQYQAVRIKSILRKAEERSLAVGPMVAPDIDVERNLILELLRMSSMVTRTIEQRAPHHLTEYTYEVAAAFSRFYDVCHILSEPDTARQSSWLALSQWTLRFLATALDLLGIEVPDRM